ncbi:hypothetical protein FA15DRAFT_674404 [Coprinopsis marcescibilis]|uniref:Uncharacterized protein n=1 Tax=Coprinopsis marcescibilis TaxID=230819 RepID=A0A5C3KH42_COPMA|nr:hypothetical protein FA15DRAFT_674404 [Coprinopsis marcescibilis]
MTPNVMLEEDGSNWADYKHRVLNQLYAKGLYRYVHGTIPRPVEIVKHNPSRRAEDPRSHWYLPSDSNHSRPLSHSEVNEYHNALTQFLKQDSTGWLYLMSTLPYSIYIFIRKHTTLAEKWKALCNMYENRQARDIGIMSQLSRLRFNRSGPRSLRSHLAYMMELRDEAISGTQAKVFSDDLFSRFIAGSLEQDPYLSTTAKTSQIGSPTPSDKLINTLLRIEEEMVLDSAREPLEKAGRGSKRS